MESTKQSNREFDTNPAYYIEKEIKDFTSASELNLMPDTKQAVILINPCPIR